MNRVTAIASGIVVLIILLGGGVFLFSRSHTNSPVTQKTVTPTVTTSATEKNLRVIKNVHFPILKPQVQVLSIQEVVIREEILKGSQTERLY